MAGLERLRILLLWTNVTGLLPFRMELDRDSGKFHGFLFSYRHPLTWWLVIWLTLQLAIFAVVHVNIMPILCQQELAPIVKNTFLVQHANSFVFCFSPDLILFRWKNLATAVKYVNKFDRIVGDSGNRPCQTKRRIGIGLVLAATHVGSFIYQSQSVVC